MVVRDKVMEVISNPADCFAVTLINEKLCEYGRYCAVGLSNVRQ